jgi:hypothetical protein
LRFAILNPVASGSQDTDRQERLQRVRIGVTGLAVVFLMVMSAGALTRSASDESPVGDQADVQVPGGLPELVGNNLAQEDLPKEPLAELGVAPSSTPANDSTSTEGPTRKGP